MWSKIRSFAFVLAGLAALSGPALASQGSGCMPTTGTVSGLALVTDINAAIAALISSNSGSSAPATDCSGLAILGQFWIDTSGSFPVVKMYDGTSWVPFGTVDTTNHIWAPVIGGGTNSVTAATTTDLCSVPQGYVTIAGNTTITGFGSSCVTGQIKYLNFTGTPQITYDATNLIVPGAANIPVSAGDQAVAAYIGSGHWRIISYTPASGSAIVNPSLPVGSVVFSAAFSPSTGYALAYGQTFSRSTFAALLSAVTSAQTGTRSSGSPIITSLSDTSQFFTGQKVEGTGIPAGAAILTVDSATQITLNMNASSSGSNTVTVFAYGNGDGSTTFTGLDCRDTVLVGRGNMNGTDRALLSATYFGASPTGLGSLGGSDHTTFALGNLPSGNFPKTLAISDTRVWQGQPTHGYFGAANGINSDLTSTPGADTFYATMPIAVISGTIGLTGDTQTGGSGTPISRIPPALILNCFVKTTN